MAGIQAFGAYVPCRRLQRAAVYEANEWFAPGLRALAKGERAICGWDEDVVTMAVEAARDCLPGYERCMINSVILASTSAPFDDRQNAGIVKEALNLSDTVATMDVGGSQKAGATALMQAFYAAAGQEVLVIGSEKRKARPGSEDELSNGDAAAAFVVGPDDGVARLLGAHSLSIDFVDHFRAADSDFDCGWESRWVRDEGYAKFPAAAAVGALEKSKTSASAISRLILGVPVKGTAEALAKQLGIPAEAVVDNFSAALGHAGCAHPLVMLAHTLEAAKPGEKLLVIGFGQGADALVFEVTDKIAAPRVSMGVSGWLARGVKQNNYLKYLAQAGHLRLELGKRAEFKTSPVLSGLYRNRKAVFGLVGGRCPKTGSVQFPKSQIGVNQNEAEVTEQEDYPLAERQGAILTYTADSLSFTPDPPNYYGMIEFEGGGRLFAEFADAGPQNVYVGAPVRMMFRIKSRDPSSGFVHYFWKAAPTARSK